MSRRTATTNRRQRRGDGARIGWFSASLLVIIAAVPPVMAYWYVTTPTPIADERPAVPTTDGKASEQSKSPKSYPSPQLTTAVDSLVALVDPGLAQNSYFPQFARERLQWMVREMRADRLQIVLLEDLANSNLTPHVLMGSGTIDGKRSIIIAQPRFLEFLEEGPGPSGPFTQEQKNDFMLGLVHEVVHLQKVGLPEPARVAPGDRVGEEVRAWREVNLNVVRPLRAINQPVHGVFRDVDDAFRACGDGVNCRPAAILAP